MATESDLEQNDYKNALPDEVADGRTSDSPRQLRTVADGQAPLSRAEADVAGISVTPEVVYGDADADPNRDDQIDMNQAGPDEHV